MPGRYARSGYNGRKKKVDANQPEIVEALEKIGASVFSLGKPVDLLVGYQGKTYLLEVKNPEGKSIRKRTDSVKLEPAQEEFIADWRGRPVSIVLTTDDALAAIGALSSGGLRGSLVRVPR
jgi:hypothetical protein